MLYDGMANPLRSAITLDTQRPCEGLPGLIRPAPIGIPLYSIDPKNHFFRDRVKSTFSPFISMNYPMREMRENVTIGGKLESKNWIAGRPLRPHSPQHVARNRHVQANRRGPRHGTPGVGSPHLAVRAVGRLL